MTKLLEEIHPGEILLEDFMKPMGIRARLLASDIDVSPSRISELVDGLRPITAETPLRLGSMLCWPNCQDRLARPPRAGLGSFGILPRACGSTAPADTSSSCSRTSRSAASAR